MSVGEDIESAGDAVYGSVNGRQNATAALIE